MYKIFYALLCTFFSLHGMDKFFLSTCSTAINHTTIYSNTDLRIVHQSRKKIFAINGKRYSYELIQKTNTQSLLFWDEQTHTLLDINGAEIEPLEE